MNSEGKEKNTLRLLLFGSFFTTIALSPWLNEEPVNYVKLVTLASAACALLVSFLIPSVREILKNDRFTSALILLFSVQALISTLTSSDAKTQNFYGVFGRNTGFLTYFSLSVIFLSATQLRKYESFNKIIKILFYSGLVNIVYCLSVIFGYDPIPWENIFGAPLGTFGNPNFIGAFLGFIFVLCFVYLLQNAASMRTKASILLLLTLLGFEIHETNAIQGIVVALIGVSFTLFLYMRSKELSSYITSAYVFIITSVGILGVMGALQVGPLTSIIYKSSISLRGVYWMAGFKTGLANFWLGAGMDSYGTWFRRSRDITKLGPDVITNSSHNVFLDLFASGGIILVTSYILITGFVAIQILRHIKKFRTYDPVFVSLSAVWICYQAQSLISINQIGLAVWGWLLGGSILAYVKLGVVEGGKSGSDISKRAPLKSVEVAASTVLLSLAGALIGFAVSLPPLLADANWRSALTSKDQDVFESALHQWPRDPVRYAKGLRIYLENNIQDKSYSTAKSATLEFPNDYYSWYNLGIIPSISASEKAEIETQLKPLGPNNPKRP